MDVAELMQYLDNQNDAIQELVDQLDEVQVAFNAEYDRFRSEHDAQLDTLSEEVCARLEDMDSALQTAVEERYQEELSLIDERSEEVRVLYLPERQQSADSLLAKAQADRAKLRALNPELDAREEDLKRQKASLGARLAELNEDIKKKSAGLGVVLHFMAITEADRDRQRVIGKIEVVNNSLQAVRDEWVREAREGEERQAEYQRRWRLESMAVARLQAELERIEDQGFRQELALRRAVRHVLDALKDPLPGPVPEIDSGLREMVALNSQTDSYHVGLASVGGVIGLLRGVLAGMQAIQRSIAGLANEQEMHKAYLSPLAFRLPPRVEEFHTQWPVLAKQFSDEDAVGAHPSRFSEAVTPLLEGPLSQASIESMFNDIGTMIEHATAEW
jgi:hypothetical protein